MAAREGERLKRKPCEESINVSGVIRWPGKIKPGMRSKQFFTHVDFAPTVLGFAGLQPLDDMQGENPVPAILGGNGGPASHFCRFLGPFAGDGTTDGWRGVTRAGMFSEQRR